MNHRVGKIGPHEEREFELFKSGEKDVIYFQFDYQPDGHREIAKDLGAKLLTFVDPNFKLPNFIYYREGFLSEAEELRDIVVSGLNMFQSDWPEKEHKVGRILGYSREDVELFINNFRAHHDKKH